MGFPVEYAASMGPRARATTTAGRAGCARGCGRRSPRPTRPHRLRRHPPVRGAARRAARRQRPRSGAGGRCGSTARAACRSAAPARSTPCSSRASSPSRRTVGRPSRFATAPTGSGRSCSSTARSCSSAPRPRPSSGSSRGKTNVLVTLGQGAEVREATARCLRALAGRDGVQVAALSSAIAALDDAAVPEGVIELRATYPMSRYFAAFDAAVAAAGYNAFHELIALGVPTLFVPMRRETDDQPARARYAESPGIGLGVEGPGGRRPRGEARAPARRRARSAIAARLAELDPPTAPPKRPRWLAELAEPGRGGPVGVGRRPSARAWRDFRRRWGQFAASLPRTAVRLTRQQLTQPRAADGDPRARGRRRRPRGGAARRSPRRPTPPSRVLVVTDSLAALGRAAGARGRDRARPGPRLAPGRARRRAATRSSLAGGSS